MKKFYESPSVEKNSFMVAENLMNLPEVSGNGYGMDEFGPAGWQGHTHEE